MSTQVAKTAYNGEEGHDSGVSPERKIIVSEFLRERDFLKLGCVNSVFASHSQEGTHDFFADSLKRKMGTVFSTLFQLFCAAFSMISKEASHEQAQHSCPKHFALKNCLPRQQQQKTSIIFCEARALDPAISLLDNNKRYPMATTREGKGTQKNLQPTGKNF